jgi:subtilisin family serine protease
VIRVAVVDSGVNPRHPHIAGIAGGVSIAADGALEEGSFLDRLGHGTAVMAAIQEKAPGAEYYAVRIFHEALRTSSLSLLRAMEWAVNHNMDVINLSLGTTNPSHAELFCPVVDRAVAKGLKLVSAVNCYPGLLPGVIAVDLDPDCDRETFYRRGDIYVAAGYPRSAPGIPRERNLQGISFAVANVSGFLARKFMNSDTSAAP